NDGKLQTSETWNYSCTTTAKASDENANHQIVNTATTSGKDSLNKTVTDTDTHTTTIIAPAIQIVKSGPATAHDGDSLTFTYVVTNTGDTTLSNVTVTDDKCSPVTYASGDSNNDGKLQTSETWHYTCTS